jgi:hypothetical protein
MDEGDSLSIVFHTALDAMRFSLSTQEDLMTADWPAELLEHPSGARDGLYAGLRVRMVVDVGHASKFLNKVTNRLSYDGEVVTSCKNMEKIVADGGVVIATTGVLQALQEKHSARLYELGSYHVQDIGDYETPADPNIPDDKPGIVSLVQVLPMMLHERPASKINAPRLAYGFSEAPGVGQPDSTPVAIIFCSLSDETGVGEGLLANHCNRNGGYVCKNSQGVCLLAFKTCEAAVAFLFDVATQLTAHPDIQFKAGLHYGIPSSIASNKGSGRADYHGPPVNTAARLLALGGDSKLDVFQRGNSAVAVSGTAWANSGQAKEILESQGKFTLKGIADEMEAFALNFNKPGSRYGSRRATAVLTKEDAAGGTESAMEVSTPH